MNIFTYRSKTWPMYFRTVEITNNYEWIPITYVFGKPEVKRSKLRLE